MTGTLQQILTWLIANITKADPNKLYELKEHREKRTLTQNAYYWQLVGQVAKKLRTPSALVHNTMLREYSTPMIISGQAVRAMLPDTDETEQTALLSDTVHLRPTSQTTVMRDGSVYRTYVMLKGSHEMNTVEMSRLVDGIIEEAKAQGIETMTPRELERIRQIERERENKKDSNSKNSKAESA